MSDLGPAAPVDVGSATGEIVDAAVGELAVSDLSLQLLDLALTDNVDEAIKLIDQARTAYVSNSTPAQLEQFDALRVDLERAWRSGALPPSQTVPAIKWISTNERTTKITPTMLRTGAISRWLTLYGVSHGHPATHTHKATTTTATKAITVGGEGEGTRTAGGRIVGAAEASVRPATITAPGLTATEAKAISLAIETSYGDTMHVLIGVVNELVARIDAGDRSTGTKATTAGASTKALADLAAKLEADQRLTTSRITAIEKALAGERTTEAKLATKVDAIARQPKTTTDPALARRVTAVERGLSGVQAKLPTLATAGMVAPVVAGVAGLRATQRAITAELQTSGVANLPPTIQQLEDCCYANSQITNPMRKGGATPSLLRQLGSILTKGYALLLVAGAVDAVIGIFDMPAVVLGTIRGAEWVMPVAEEAARAAMSDISWGDTVAGKS